MGLPIFYVYRDGIEPPGGSIIISGDHARHLSRSLRARTGDTVLVGDGNGTRCNAKITCIGHREVELKVESCETVAGEIPAVTLIQAVSDPRRMDEVVARAAETGIARIVPFVSPRSRAGARERGESRLERWRKIAREASMVALRARLLEVDDLEGWPMYGKVLSPHGLDIVLWEGEVVADLSGMLPADPPRSIGILVGPEGGFAQEEVEELETAGARTASLGDLILRAESAGSYAAMLIRYHYGLLSPTEASRSG